MSLTTCFVLMFIAWLCIVGRVPKQKPPGLPPARQRGGFGGDGFD